MKIIRKLDTSSATYTFEDLSDKEFNDLYRAYEHYMYYTRHCPPSEEDGLWQKMSKLQAEKVTVI